MLRVTGSLPARPKMSYLLKGGVASAAILLTLPSSASPPPKVAAAINILSLEEKDYMGYLRAMTEGTGQVR